MIDLGLILEHTFAPELESFGVDTPKSLGRKMLSLAREARDYVKSAKLSGQVLKPGPRKKKWPLKRSIAYKRVLDADGISAKVFTPIHFYVVHEEGWSGQESVKSFLRRAKAEKFFFRGGKKAGQINRTKTRKALQAKKATVKVKAFTRNVTFPERSFMRSALVDLAPHIISELDKAAKDSIE
jgi:hypothetical protein